MPSELLHGDFQPLLRRCLDVEVLRKFDYRVGTDRSGKAVQIATYRDADGTPVAQKIRDSAKEFCILGDASKMGLYGQHLWPSKGRRVVVTEGEIDALSICQATGLTWPVVSLPNGAKSAKKAIQKNLEWLCGFEQVVLAYDMDEAGRAAAAECAPLFPPGKAAIWEIPRKDANEMLVAGEVKQISDALWKARSYRPDGIVNGADLWDRITSKQAPGIPYPWEELTRMTSGQRKGTLVTWTAGSGLGKSTAVAQVAYDLAFNHGLKVGYVALEEDVGRSAQRFLSLRLGKLVHLPGTTTEAELREAFDATLGSGRIWLHDHFGSCDADDLISKLRYLAKGCECDVLVVDHVSIVVSGMDLSGDERRAIDRTMTLLRTLVEECKILMHLISHLKRLGDDRGHEDGAKVSLSHLRGSQSIAQLSDIVIGMERNQQAEGDEARVAQFRVLKNRTTGETGAAGRVIYDKESGKLVEMDTETVFSDESDDQPPF